MVARVAAREIRRAEPVQARTNLTGGGQIAASRLLCSMYSFSRSCTGNARTMPAMAAKLSWKDSWVSINGSHAVMARAAKARAGSRLRGLPKAMAASNTLPMTAALRAEGGRPLMVAYSQMAPKGASR